MHTAAMQTVLMTSKPAAAAFSKTIRGVSQHPRIAFLIGVARVAQTPTTAAVRRIPCRAFSRHPSTPTSHNVPTLRIASVLVRRPQRDSQCFSLRIKQAATAIMRVGPMMVIRGTMLRRHAIPPLRAKRCYRLVSWIIILTTMWGRVRTLQAQ